jgi:hypothetical protein
MSKYDDNEKDDLDEKSLRRAKFFKKQTFKIDEDDFNHPKEKYKRKKRDYLEDVE